MGAIDDLLLLTEPDRLAVAGALATASRTTAELVAVTGLAERAVLTALGDLRASALVVADGNAYRLDVEALRELARAVTEASIPMDPAIGYGMTDEERVILDRYFAGRTLIAIPHQRAKFQVVLQRLALEFDVGRRYTEDDVNAVLHPFHTDWSTLRRGLVDEGFLDREHLDGVTWYWRSGGRVTPLPA